MMFLETLVGEVVSIPERPRPLPAALPLSDERPRGRPPVIRIAGDH